MRLNADVLILEERAGNIKLTRMNIIQTEEGATLPLVHLHVDWCAESCKGDFAPHYDPDKGFVFLFTDPNDAFAYRMRWQ